MGNKQIAPELNEETTRQKLIEEAICTLTHLLGFLLVDSLSRSIVYLDNGRRVKIEAKGTQSRPAVVGDIKTAEDLLRKFMNPFRKLAKADGNLSLICNLLNDALDKLQKTNSKKAQEVVEEIIGESHTGNTTDAKYILFSSISSNLIRILTVLECYLHTFDGRCLDTVLLEIIQIQQDFSWMGNLSNSLRALNLNSSFDESPIKPTPPPEDNSKEEEDD